MVGMCEELFDALLKDKVKTISGLFQDILADKAPVVHLLIRHIQTTRSY
jgi:hypothetical protein